MIKLIPIKVECHSGYKADEYPVSFHREDYNFEVEEIIDRWYQVESNPEYPAANYFKVRLVDGNQLILKHELEIDKWFLCQ